MNCHELLAGMEISAVDDVEKSAGSEIISAPETVDGHGSRLAGASEVRQDDGMALLRQR